MPEIRPIKDLRNSNEFLEFVMKVMSLFILRKTVTGI